MNRFEKIAIMGIILVSLFPVYLLYKYGQRRLRPRESLHRFLGWVLSVLVLVFLYTFLLVFILKLLFPRA